MSGAVQEREEAERQRADDGALLACVGRVP